MFNTPILDVAIGLVFIFLLYSLLATSVKEAIATALGLRARMLRKGIMVSMLSDTSEDSRIESIWKGIKEYFLDIVWMIKGRPKKKPGEINIGDKFYDHPLIKNYGSNRIFPFPSYLPTANFSTVLIDVLKDDFDRNIRLILNYKNMPDPDAPNKSTLTLAELQNDTDAIKIKNLLDYYAYCYINSSKPAGVIIDKETLTILRMHLTNSLYNLETFRKKLENWFDESMDRVSGWYKRQAQIILFIIGMIVGIIFNVDTIEIVKKLSKDDKLRDQVVQSAIAYSKSNQTPPPTPAKPPDSATSVNDVSKKFSQVDSFLNKDIHDINALMALGYDDYGRTDTAFVLLLKNKIWIDAFSIIHNKDFSKEIDDSFDVKYPLVKNATPAMVNVRDSLKSIWYYDYQMKNYPIHVKTAYIWYVGWNQKRKWLGFLILAFAVCLGAPFWFDMLNKIINVRGSGKKEGGATPSKKTKTQAPVTVNINNKETGEETVG